VVEVIAEKLQKRQTVLVGTTSIEKNEHLSHLLRVRGIPHELLNAKNMSGRLPSSPPRGKRER
jgi:preprotein translocase subunit SecA